MKLALRVIAAIGILIMLGGIVFLLNGGYESDLAGVLFLEFFGLIFYLFGAIPVYLMARREKVVQWLLANGVRIQTKISEIYQDESVSYNGKNPWVIESQWQDPNNDAIRVFKSERMWFDPSEFLNGDMIDVLLKPNDAKVYYMDTSQLKTVE